MTIDADTLERLARAIHANYLAEFAPDGAPWEELDEDARDANRDQARDIEAKLALIGAALEPVTVDGRGEFAFTGDELERLSRKEHDRWCAQKRANGWRLGERDNAGKRHPSLVGWDELSELDRDKDRDAVRHIPDVLAAVGLRVVRTSS